MSAVARPTTAASSPRAFGLLIAGAIAVFFALIPWLRGKSFPAWPSVAALSFAALALLYPASLGWLRDRWMQLGHVLGVLNSYIVLALLFWGVLTPLALLFRLARRDVLNLRSMEPAARTYRVAARAANRNERMEKPF